MAVEVTIRADDLRRWAREVLPRLDTALRNAVDAARIQIVVEAKREAPVSPGGGHLRDSIRNGAISGSWLDGTLMAEIVAGGDSGNGEMVDYAAPVHFGSKRHVIKPRPPRRFLRFRGSSGFVYARQVTIPAQPANPFLTRGADAAAPRIQATTAALIQRAVDPTGGR